MAEAARKPHRRSAPLPAVPAEPFAPLAAWKRWALAAALPALLVAQRLSLDLWADEVYTLVHFVVRDWGELFTGPWQPNHHLAYTALLKAWAEISLVTVWLRLPGLLMALATLALVFRIGERWGRAGTGELAVLALGTNQMYLSHVAQLRGYGLSALLVAGLLELALWSAVAPRSRAESLGRATAAALVGGLCLATVPTNALFWLPLAALAMAGCWRSRRNGAALALTTAGWLAGALLAAAVYWPIRHDLQAAQGDGAGLDPLWPVRLSVDLAWAGQYDFWPLWLIVALLTVGGALSGWPVRRPRLETPWRGQAWLLAALAATLVGTLAGTWALGRPPFVRNYVPLLPVLSLLLGGCLAWLASSLLGRQSRPESERAPPRGPAWPTAWAAGLLLLVVGPALVSFPERLDRVRRLRPAQDGYFNYYAARFAPAALVEGVLAELPPEEPYLIACDAADFRVVHYYLHQAGAVPIRVPLGAGPVVPVRVIWIAPPLAQYEFAAERWGISAEQFSELPRWIAGEYYSAYRSDRLISARIEQPAGAALP